MGNIFMKKTTRILWLGLENAGKTTLLYKIKIGEVKEEILNSGLKIEHVTHKDIRILSWDCGSCGFDRSLYEDSSAVIFVIDSNDRERLKEAKQQLKCLLKEEPLSTIPILIFANKQDLPNAMSVEEVEEKMELNKLNKQAYKIYGTMGNTGQNLYEGLDWLSNELFTTEKTSSDSYWNRGMSNLKRMFIK